MIVRVFAGNVVNPDLIEIEKNNNGEFTSTTHVYSGWTEKSKITLHGKKLDDVYQYKPGYWTLAVDNPATIEEVNRQLACEY